MTTAQEIAEFSPGPWHVEPLLWDHGASLAIIAADGFIVAEVSVDPDIQDVDEPDYNTVKRHVSDQPNAQLLAAAPEMLQILKLVAEAVENSGEHHDKGPLTQMWLRDGFLAQLSEVIDKATPKHGGPSCPRIRKEIE